MRLFCFPLAARNLQRPQQVLMPLHAINIRKRYSHSTAEFLDPERLCARAALPRRPTPLGTLGEIADTLFPESEIVIFRGVVVHELHGIWHLFRIDSNQFSRVRVDRIGHGKYVYPVLRDPFGRSPFASRRRQEERVHCY